MTTTLHWLIFYLLTTGLLLPPASTVPDVLFQVNDISVNYPRYIQFQLAASSAVNISTGTLVYGVDHLSCQASASRQALDFQPGKQVNLEWRLEFSRSGILPPGSEIWWYWEIGHESGEVFQSEKKSATIQDQRYEWRKLTLDGLTVQWYQGTTDFGQAILRYAKKDLGRISKQMNIQPAREIWITVYASSEELRLALVRSNDWVGAAALPDFSAILLGLAPSELSDVDHFLAHELTHLVVGELTFNCMGVELPTWLHEGLAENTQGKPGQEELDAVILAIESRNLPSLGEIANGFSPDSEQARLEYTQSYLVVEYLMETYGPQKMRALLESFQSGLMIDEALQKVYGMDTVNLEVAWQESLGFPGIAVRQINHPTRTLVPTIALWVPDPSPTQTPAPTATPTSARTTSPTASLPAPAVKEFTITPVPVVLIPDRSQFPPCLGALILPAVLFLYLSLKKESVS